MDLPLLECEVAVVNKLASLCASVRALLATPREYVDVVLVDCAPGISVMMETWLRECDHHLVPVKPDFLAVTDVEYVRRFRSRNPEMDFANHLGLVINMLEPISKPNRVMIDHLRADPDLTRFEAPIPFSNQLQRAALISAEPRSNVAKYAGDLGRAVGAVTDGLVARLERHPTSAISANPSPAGSRSATSRIALYRLSFRPSRCIPRPSPNSPLPAAAASSKRHAALVQRRFDISFDPLPFS